MPAPANTLEAARAHLAGGRVAEAEAACVELLRQDDADVHALYLLALIRAQTGRVAEGAALLERVAGLAPESAAARSDLGAMLIMGMIERDRK